MDSREIDTRRFRVYTLDGSWKVLVGKTDRDNDYLSLTFAEQNDYWFHTEGHPGAHVLLLHHEEEPRRPVLEQAAAIAAWHSKARKAKKVGVSLTKAQNVGKRRGSPAGQVVITKEQVLRVVPGLPEGE